MSEPRENAPLVELIAELRWSPDPSQMVFPQVMGGQPGPQLITGNAQEGFFLRFGNEAHRLQHLDTERLMPGGFPATLHQPVYRFRQRTPQGQTTTLYQVGPGLFSANAVPPYESWSTFEPVVRNGVQALIASRDRSEIEVPFSAISLRYIDAFTPYHTEGRDVRSFLQDVLGVSIQIPEGLTQHLRTGETIRPVLQLQIPMQDGYVMNVAFGEGVANDIPAVMMDATISTTFPITASLDAVMQVFAQEHAAIDSSFTSLIARISHLMPVRARREQ